MFSEMSRRSIWVLSSTTPFRSRTRGWRICLRLKRVSGDGIADGERALHEVHVAENRREQVVEVVRDAARQPSHRLHLLRLRELRLERSALGRIFDEQLENRARVIGGLEAPAHPDGDRRAVAARPVGVHAQDPARVPHAVHQRQERHRIVVHLVRQAHADEILDRIRAQQLRERRVRVEDHAVDPAPADSVDRVLDHGPVAGLGRVQRDLARRRFARPEPEHHELRGVAGVGRHAHALEADVERPPVGPRHRQRALDDGAARVARREIREEPVSRDRGGERRARRDAADGEVDAGGVCGDDTPPRFDERHRLGQGACENEERFRGHAPTPGVAGWS
jgi:hypothetical protein